MRRSRWIGLLVFTDGPVDCSWPRPWISRCHDHLDRSCALCGGGHRDRARVRRRRGDARATRADAGHAGRTHPAFSRCRRALALRAHALAESSPMRRAHRAVHRALWPVLALAVALGLTMALALRPPPDPPAPPATQESKP